MLNDVYKPRVGDVVKCNALNLLFTLVYDEKSDSEYTYGEDFNGIRHRLDINDLKLNIVSIF